MNRNKVMSSEEIPQVKLKSMSSFGRGVPRSRSRDSINKVQQQQCYVACV